MSDETRAIRSGILRGFDTPSWIEVYQHGHLLAVLHTVKNRHVTIDTQQMTPAEIRRGVRACALMLERAPVNRRQRRAQASKAV